MKNKWYRLDNAALIFPAIMKRKWNNVFRLSVTLREPVDPVVLSRAANSLRKRFPTFFVRLQTGFFWKYLEETGKDISIREEYAYPLTHMSKRELGRCCTRIMYYGNRISAEFFHSVTDGTGGLIFLENLTARYLEMKHGISVPAGKDILDLSAPPSDEEIRDRFLECSGRYAFSRSESTVYRLHGTPEMDLFRHITTGIVPTEKLKEAAHAHNVTVNSFLAAVMASAVIDRQSEDRPEKRYLPVKITVPVNLRRVFNVYTLRNFALTVNVGVDPKTGDYTIPELCSQISHQVAYEVVPQKMAARIAANVLPQNNPVLRVMPLFIKHIAMRGVYLASAEKKGCLNVSNLGEVSIPDIMEPYIERFEFVVGVQLTYPNNCSVVSFGGNTYINMIRNTKDSELERLFFSKLVELGIPVGIETNRRDR